MNEFEKKSFNFGGSDGDDRLYAMHTIVKDNSNTNATSTKLTDWADFDSYFKNLEISDNKAFPILEQKVNLLNSNNISMTSMNHDNLIDPFNNSKKTFAEVTASWDQNRSDDNANDIKRWPSALISAEEELNSTDPAATQSTSSDDATKVTVTTNGPTSPET